MLAWAYKVRLYTQDSRHTGAAKMTAMSSAAFPPLAAITSTAVAGQGGPTPPRNLRTFSFTWWASAAMYPSQSTFHSPRSRD